MDRKDMKPSAPLKLFVSYRALASMVLFSAYTAVAMGLGALGTLFAPLLFGLALVFEFPSIPAGLGLGALLSGAFALYGFFTRKLTALRFRAETGEAIER